MIVAAVVEKERHQIAQCRDVRAIDHIAGLALRRDRPGMLKRRQVERRTLASRVNRFVEADNGDGPMKLISFKICPFVQRVTALLEDTFSAFYVSDPTHLGRVSEAYRK